MHFNSEDTISKFKSNKRQSLNTGIWSAMRVFFVKAAFLVILIIYNNKINTDSIPIKMFGYLRHIVLKKFLFKSDIENPSGLALI